MAAWIHVFLDIPRGDFFAAADFWAAVTDGSLSAQRGERDQFATLVPPAGSAWVKLQAVDGAGGVHLDLDAAGRARAQQRSLALGATQAWVYDEVPVMRSPGGFTFCHTLSSGPASLSRTGDCLLDQVCLDVPRTLWENEIAFWSALLDRPLQHRARPEFALLAPPNANGLRVLLQRTQSDAGRVTAHPDFAVTHRASEIRRHQGLGAQHLADHDHWTVMRAPYGQVYCLTDRNPRTGVVDG